MCMNIAKICIHFAYIFVHNFVKPENSETEVIFTLLSWFLLGIFYSAIQHAHYLLFIYF